MYKELLDFCKKEDHFRARFYKADHATEAVKTHELEHNFILCLLQPTSRQFSQGLILSCLCPCASSVVDYQATQCHVSAAYLCTRKQTESKKEMLPRQLRWMNYPPFSFLGAVP